MLCYALTSRKLSTRSALQRTERVIRLKWKVLRAFSLPDARTCDSTVSFIAVAWVIGVSLPATYRHRCKRPCL